MTIAILANQTGTPVGPAFDILCELAPRARRIGHGYKIKGAEIPAVRAALLASKRSLHPAATLASIPKPAAPELPFDAPVPGGMTLVEIAELCRVGVTTVRRWADAASAEMAQVRAKLADAQELKKPARFSEPEVLAIIRAGGRGHEADLLASSSTSKPPATDKPARPAARLPSGAQLRELRLMGEKRILSAGQIQDLLGVRERIALTAPSTEPPKAPAAVAEAAFGAMTERFGAGARA